MEILQLWGHVFVENLALLIQAPWGISNSLSILSIQLWDFIIKLSSIIFQSSFEWHSMVVTIYFLSQQLLYNHSLFFMISMKSSFTQPHYLCSTSSIFIVLILTIIPISSLQVLVFIKKPSCFPCFRKKSQILFKEVVY